MHEGILYLGLLDDGMIELDVAALELSAVDHPGVDLQPYRDLLGAIWAATEEAGRSSSGQRERAAILADVIGGRERFAGDREGYDAPVNADLIRVIDRRLGLPVSLSILYVAAARRLGWRADALDTPGHVIVRIGEGSDAVLIDPFAGGHVVEPQRLAAILAYGTGSATGERTNFRPMTNREVLIRLLLNQAIRAEQAADHDRAAVLYERMTVIAPGYGQGWWDLARIQLGLGEIERARSSLIAMLEVTLDEDRRQAINAALTALSRSGAA